MLNHCEQLGESANAEKRQTSKRLYCFTFVILVSLDSPPWDSPPFWAHSRIFVISNERQSTSCRVLLLSTWSLKHLNSFFLIRPDPGLVTTIQFNGIISRSVLSPPKLSNTFLTKQEATIILSSRNLYLSYYFQPRFFSPHHEFIVENVSLHWHCSNTNYR